jgi:biotin-dependent carboxylase-like uncharacterized protein
MPTPVLQVLAPGLGGSIQDRGRAGWRKFGVPPGGVMDEHAARWANRLLDNPADAPVLELLLQGARFVALREVWLAVTGAHAHGTVPMWRAVQLHAGATIEFPRNQCGVWIYLAVEGGFSSPRILGSASANPRAGLGAMLRAGDVLRADDHQAFGLPAGVSGRAAPMLECRKYDAPPPLRIWPAPQASLFSEADRQRLCGEPWQVLAQSDRVGYRLTGMPLMSRPSQILSEPVRVGTIQIPESGQPIVTMRDGPTVGGYPKLGLVHPDDLSWLAQCRPGQEIRFRPAHET